MVYGPQGTTATLTLLESSITVKTMASTIADPQQMAQVSVASFYTPGHV